MKLAHTIDNSKFFDPKSGQVFTRLRVRDLAQPWRFGCATCGEVFDSEEFCLIRDDGEVAVHTYSQCSGIDW